MSRVDEIATALFSADDAAKKPRVKLPPSVISLLEGPQHQVSARWLCALTLKALASPLFMSPRELARASGIAEKRIRNLIRAGKLRVWREPGSQRFKATLADLIDAMESRPPEN